MCPRLTTSTNLLPFFVNANLVLAAPYKEINDPDLQYVIVLHVGISFRNTSFPRGLTSQHLNSGFS